MTLRSPLGRVLGMGAAKEGVRHWWHQRLTSIALVPLSIWFVTSLLALPGYDHATLTAWMSHSLTALLLALFVLVSAWHSQLGVQAVIEDYVHGTGSKTLLLVLSSFAHVLLGAAGVLAVLKVALGAAP